MSLQVLSLDPSTSPFDVVAGLTTQQTLAIVRPQNPPIGVGGYVFDIEGDNTLECDSDITDHYVEDNTAIQDHWALKPETYSVKGFVAELIQTNTQSGVTDNKIPPAPIPLPPLTAFLPDFTTTQQQDLMVRINQTIFQSSSVTEANSLAAYFQNVSPQNPKQTRQSQAAKYFLSLRSSRILVTVETPYGVLTDMAIDSMSITQPEESKYQSEFTITFKKFRIAQNVSVNLGQLAGRLAAGNAKASPTQNGNVGQTAADISALNKAKQ